MSKQLVHYCDCGYAFDPSNPIHLHHPMPIALEIIEDPPEELRSQVFPCLGPEALQDIARERKQTRHENASLDGEIRRMQIGDFVKLCVLVRDDKGVWLPSELRHMRGQFESEAMWARVESREGEGAKTIYHGELWDIPVLIDPQRLQYRSPVDFEARHIHSVLAHIRSGKGGEFISRVGKDAGKAKSNLVKVRSNKARVKDHKGLSQVLGHYRFSSNTKPLLTEVEDGCTLQIQGEAWPLVWKKESELDDVGLPEFIALHGELRPDDIVEESTRRFSELLQDLAPYLETSLAVWACLLSREGKFRRAREWSVSPGVTGVEVKDIESPSRKH